MSENYTSKSKDRLFMWKADYEDGRVVDEFDAEGNESKEFKDLESDATGLLRFGFAGLGHYFFFNNDGMFQFLNGKDKVSTCSFVLTHTSHNESLPLFSKKNHTVYQLKGFSYYPMAGQDEVTVDSYKFGFNSTIQYEDFKIDANIGMVLKMSGTGPSEIVIPNFEITLASNGSTSMDVSESLAAIVDGEVYIIESINMKNPNVHGIVFG